MKRAAPIVLLLLMVAAAAAWLGGCAGGGPAPTAGRPALSSERQARAERLLADMEASYRAGLNRRVLATAGELLDRYQGFDRLDRVVELAARAATRAGDRPRALRLLGEYLDTHDTGPRLATLWELRAELLRETGDAPGAVDALLRAHALVTRDADRRRLADSVASLADSLDADALAALRDGHPASPLAPYLGYLWLGRLLAEGREAEARDAMARLERETPPGDPWLARAEQLLHAPGVRVGERALPRPGGESVDALHVGVLAPLTGRYTLLGNAFVDGVQAARDRENREGWRQFTLSTLDTEGDPVTAALACRRLLAEERPIALVGCLLSSTTVAAALVADTAGEPLVSPTATNERIGMLGPTIVQTNVTTRFEARLLARLAVDVLLKRDLAILHPDTPDGARAAEEFATAVTRRGGRIVAVAAFPPAATDFREPLTRLAAALPEAIFVPADPDQMLLLGPQLDFYRAGAVILGTSAWNSERLAREAGAVLDRAVFPSDTALFPAVWVSQAGGDLAGSDLPDEALPIARAAYLGTRLLLRTIAEDGCERPDSLAVALRRRLLDLDRWQVGLDWPRMASSLRIFRDGKVAPFPPELFAGVALAADSTAARPAAADTVAAPAPVPVVPPPTVPGGARR